MSAALRKHSVRFLSFSRLKIMARSPDIRKYINLIDRNYFLSLKIISHVFGEKWLEDKFFSNSKLSLKKIKSEDIFSPENDAFKDFIIEFAELIVLLQRHKNIHPILNEILKGKNNNIESRIFELSVAKCLIDHNLKFEFRKPTNNRHDDYDLDFFTPDGQKICTEVKCKVSTTTLSRNTLIRTLEKAKDQLPKGHAGVIFLKYPEQWIESGIINSIDRNLFDDFLRRSSRVRQIVVFIHWKDIFSTRIQRFNLMEIIHNKNYEEFSIFSSDTFNSSKNFCLSDYTNSKSQIIPHARSMFMHLN